MKLWLILYSVLLWKGTADDWQLRISGSGISSICARARGLVLGRLFSCREEETVLKKYRIRTNEFLLPILYEKDYEWLAHEIISRYFPEDPERLDAQELARRMGLRVWDVHFKDRTILGQIYYDFSNTELLDDNGNSYTARIPPGTILISRDNCSAPAVRSSTIAHECSHMYLDRWYFLLQMMGGARSPYTSRKKIRAEENSLPEKDRHGVDGAAM